MQKYQCPECEGTKLSVEATIIVNINTADPDLPDYVEFESCEHLPDVVDLNSDAWTMCKNSNCEYEDQLYQFGIPEQGDL